MQSALIQAIFGCNGAEVSRQLEYNPDQLHALDSEKRSALHAAAYVGDADVVQRLLGAVAAEGETGDPGVNAKDNRWLTPLHRACRKGAEVTAPK